MGAKGGHHSGRRGWASQRAQRASQRAQRATRSEEGWKVSLTQATSPCWALPGRRAAPCGTAPIGVQPTGQAEAPRPRPRLCWEPCLGGGPRGAWCRASRCCSPGSMHPSAPVPQKGRRLARHPTIRSGSDTHRSAPAESPLRSREAPRRWGGPPLVLGLRLQAGQSSGEYPHPPPWSPGNGSGPRAGPRPSGLTSVR